jgi:hypothetical protein
MRELKAARSFKIPIMPILFPGVGPNNLPLELSDMQYLKFSEGITDDALSKLVRAVNMFLRRA